MGRLSPAGCEAVSVVCLFFICLLVGWKPATRLSYVYVPVKVQDAWRFLMGVSDNEVPLDGISQLEGVGALPSQLQHLPDDLQRLTFHPKFNQRFSADIFNIIQYTTALVYVFTASLD